MGNDYYVKGIHEFEAEEPETWDLLAIVRESNDVPYVSWEFNCDKECVLEVFEGVTISGIPLTTDAFENENANRFIERLALPHRYSFYQSGFTITDTGHRMYHSKFGNGVSCDRKLDRAEYVGNYEINGPPTYYLFRFTKESNLAGWLDIYIFYTLGDKSG